MAGEGRSVCLRLPTRERVLAGTRQAVRACLIGWGHTDDEFVDDVLLVMGELASNAIRHGTGPVTVRVRARADAVTVAVEDRSPRMPRRRRPDALGGRGLGIVEALSREWGVQERRDGKRVWARLEVAATAAVTASPARSAVERPASAPRFAGISRSAGTAATGHATTTADRGTR